MTLLGLQSGRVLLVWKGRPTQIMARWCASGVLLCLAAGVLCKFRQNGGWIPVNKNLWSPSFIFVMAGSGNIVLAAFFALVDVRRWWSGVPFRYVGMNSIAIYVCHEVLSDYFPLHWQTDGQHAQELAANVCGVLCWVCVAYYWHEKKIFIKI